jgi:hypothetical protein
MLFVLSALKFKLQLVFDSQMPGRVVASGHAKA